MKYLKALLITLVITSTTQAETLSQVLIKPVRQALATIHKHLEDAQTIASIYANTEAIVAGNTLRKAQRNAELSTSEIILAKELIEQLNKKLIEIENSSGENAPMMCYLTIIKNLQELFLLTRHFNFAGHTWMPANTNSLLN